MKWLKWVGFVSVFCAIFFVSKLYQKEMYPSFFSSGNLQTLEARYTASQIMEIHKKELLKDAHHRFLEPGIEFFPYLLMKVKYLEEIEGTKETEALWDLTEGEMVINTKDWNKTHGFSECIKAGATTQEFKILSLLAKKGGSLERSIIAKTLNSDYEEIENWIRSCQRKKLLIQQGTTCRLHMQSPLFKLVPETKIEEKLMTKMSTKETKKSPNFTPSQIEKIAHAVFGQHFAVRSTTLVYLPVHVVTVQNPDGSIHLSYWNALNGKRL